MRLSACFLSLILYECMYFVLIHMGVAAKPLAKAQIEDLEYTEFVY
jgi:hypothetical protein